ncbi:transferase hexapeptide (six repeat-containing protein) [Prevotella sp. tc2-28]|uniref:acyltransferase n=1 Tax=Prevotella sp. tc2-28 TaxID=1761888 RepID=UPI0008961A4C|nr:acyltransferase [Prevotella sp. tc2-28]SEA09525.1 transferase hexapeptide (six repeat-containing protein) [Prevotella sp. tc2-28]
MNKILEYSLSIPKSIFFCFRCLSFRNALHLPILIRYNVMIKSIGDIELKEVGFGCVRIGFGDVGIFDKAHERSIWDVKGKVSFLGHCFIGHGSRIVVGPEGQVKFGDFFRCTSAMSLICFKEICFGYRVLVSWDTLFMDTDFHYVQDLSDNTIIDNRKPIIVGNHVWIGCRTTIMKNTRINNDSIVAAGTVVVGQYNETNIIIGGCPSRIVKKGINWKE